MIDISMPHRVVKDVIQRRHEMSLRFHDGFGGSMPDLPSSTTVLSVPTMGSSTMKFSERAKQGFHLVSMDEKVIVVREYDPREDLLSGGRCRFE
jgi:hypothetical protein